MGIATPSDGQTGNLLGWWVNKIDHMKTCLGTEWLHQFQGSCGGLLSNLPAESIQN